MHNLNSGKSGQNIWPTSLIFKKKISKENNNPRGENSPNLVTLLRAGLLYKNSPLDTGFISQRTFPL
jgi:hypothetical protein